METANNTYRLEQGDKEFIFSASIIGNVLRMTCKNSSSENHQKFKQDFTMQQFNEIDEIFNFIKTPEEALDFIDKALSDQKVGIFEENGGIKLTFYIKTDEVTKEIDIPLGDVVSENDESNGNQPFQTENISNFGATNYLGNSAVDQNNIGSLLNTGYSENNQYYSQMQNLNLYQTTPSNNTFDINQFMQTNNSYENNSSTNQYYQNNWQYSQNYESTPMTNQYMQSYQNYDNGNTYIGQVGNEQQNIFVSSDADVKGTEVNGEDVEESLKSLGTTKVLPILNTSRVLPVLGPFTDLKGIDLHALANINSQKNSNIPFQPVINNQEAQIQIIKTQQKQLTTQKSKTKLKSNANKSKKVLRKKNLSERKISKKETEEVKLLKSQLAELEPLKKKMAEMEVLRGQLTELNTLRAQVAEYNAVKGQLKEINNLRTQLLQYKNQLPKINELNTKVTENEKLKLRIKELEDINHKQEEEIKILKENEKIYIMKLRNLNIQNNDILKGKNQQEEDLAPKGDIIHNTQELGLLTKKINNLNQKLTLNLLYKASVDSDKASSFHAKCDNAKSTIVLVETDKGKRFGGYTTCSWSGDCEEKKDEEAFVFSLDKMKIYDNIPGESAVGCYPKFGPIFLGCQIRIYDKAFTKGGTTFEKGLNYETEEDYELTGGDRNFKVKEIEVYEVIKE